MFAQFEKLDLLAHVNEVASYLEEKLDELAAKHDCIKERRGKGLMQGLELSGKPVGEVITAAREKGLLVISAEHNVLRMLPPLVITKEDVDKAVAIIDSCL